MIVSNDPKKLYQKLDQAHLMLHDSISPEERLALENYISILYQAIVCLGDMDVVVDKKKCFGNEKKHQQFIRRLNTYSDRLIVNFLNNKRYHRNYLNSLIPAEEDEIERRMLPFRDMEEEEKIFTKEDFEEIMHGFMKSIGQQHLFEDLSKNGNIYSTFVGGMKESDLGFTTYNPLNKDADVFVKKFDNNLGSMMTLAHEMGHVIDLKEFDGDITEYNKYFYVSLFDEVIARTMERLLIRYLMKNNIEVNEVKDILLSFEINNIDFQVQAYILTLLDKHIISKYLYPDMKDEDIEKRIRKHFYDDAIITEYIRSAKENDLPNVFQYVYGDIISMFLADAIEEDGFGNELVQKFMKDRIQPFSEKMMEENGFDPKTYIKKYKKEMELFDK